ncbi:MAG TPA: bifunctional nuclease domain-containing protein [Dehalococcoidales bacterium]
MDIELVNLARNGDKNAFGLLVERYQAIAQRFAMRSVANSDSVQDIVQEAMLQAYLSLNSLRDPALFKSWLYGIVLNVCRHYIRDRKTVFFSIEAMAGGLQLDAIPFTDASPSPEQIAEEHELHSIVMDTINELEPADRKATLLFYYNQMSLQEIGDVLGISTSTVKVRLYRTRQRLKASLLSKHPEIISIEKRRKIMVRVIVADVVKNELKNGKDQPFTSYVIILQDEAGQRALPIWVGPFEGQSIAMGLGEYATQRPITFDFFVSLLKAVNSKIEEVRIETLKGDIFYAIVKIRCGKTSAEIDARPSDALALAVRAGSPVFVSEEVLKVAGMAIPQTAKKLPARSGVESILKEISDMQQKSQPASGQREEIMKAREKLMATVFHA